MEATLIEIHATPTFHLQIINKTQVNNFNNNVTDNKLL